MNDNTCPSHTVGSMLDVGTAADEVLVMDANGDLLPDLFGTPALSTTPSFWINHDKATSFQMYTYHLFLMQCNNETEMFVISVCL